VWRLARADVQALRLICLQLVITLAPLQRGNAWADKGLIYQANGRQVINYSITGTVRSPEKARRRWKKEEAEPV
jgi:hypothetical protein